MKYPIKTTAQPKPDSRVPSKIHGAGSGLALLGFLLGMLICVATPAWAAQPVKTTFAWGFNSPDGIAFDAAGNLYVANNGNGTISKVTSDGTVGTFATGFSGPYAVAFDSAGNLYVANGYSHSVSKVTPGGAVSTFASGFSGPIALAFDGADNLYVANWQNDSVSKVTPGGAVSTFAAGFARPFGLTCDSAGNLYVANLFGGSVSKVTSGGSVSTFAVGMAGPAGLAFDPAGNLYVANLYGDWVSKVTPSGAVSVFTAGFGSPRGLAFDSATNLYVSEPYWNQIRKVAPPIIGPSDIFLSSSSIQPSTGTNVALGTLAADNYDTATTHTYALVSGDGDTDNAAFSISGDILQVNDLAVMAEGSYSVRIVTEDGEGHPFSRAFLITVDGTDPTVTSVVVPAAATYMGGQNLDFTVNLSETVTVTGLPALELTVGTVVRNAEYLSGSGSSNLLFRYTVPAGDNDTDGIVAASSIALNGGAIRDAAGNDAILTFDPLATDGVLVDTLAPTITSIIRLTPAPQFTLTNRVVFQATFSKPVTGVGINGFVVTPINNSTVTGTVTSVSGGPMVYEVEVSVTSGAGDFRVDASGPSSAFLMASGLNRPNALAAHPYNGFYVANDGDNTVSLVDNSGILSTYATGFNAPQALAVSSMDSLYVANAGDNTVSEVNYGSVSTYASGFNQPRALAADNSGNLYVGNYGDGSVIKLDYGSPSSFATGLDGLDSLAIDSAGNLYVGNSTNNLVTKVTSTGVMSTYATNLNQPRALALDNQRNLYVANYGDHSVSRVATNGIVSTFASGFPAPIALAFQDSSLYVADQTNGTITRLTPVWINDLAGNAFSGPSYSAGERYTLIDNAALTDLSLSSNIVKQSAGPNATVGTLSTTGADGSDTHTYAFVAGTGDMDNASFAIETNALLVGVSALVAGNYSIRVQADNGYGGFYEEAFTITVVDDVAPTISLSEPSLIWTTAGPVTFSVTYSGADAISLTAQDIVVNSTGTASVATVEVSGSDNIHTITLSGITGAGTLAISINSGTASDLAENTAPAAGPSSGFSVTDGLLKVTSNLDSGDDATIGSSLAEDQADGNGLSLREALHWAPAGYTIGFDLDSSTAGDQGGTITLSGTEMIIVRSVTIDGDVDNDSVPDVTVSGNSASRVFQINATGATVRFIGLIVSGGSTSSEGAGIYQVASSELSLQYCIVQQNTTTSSSGGGGLYLTSGALSVSDSTFFANVADRLGGAARISGSGDATFINCTISGNQTTYPVTGYMGSGIYCTTPGALTLLNTTISGNSTYLTGGHRAGGMYRSGGTTFIYNSTIVGNTAPGTLGGVYLSGTVTMVNTVVAGNARGSGATPGADGSAVATGSSYSDVLGTITFATNCYFGTSATITTGSGNLTNQGTANLLLGNLTNNGGFVSTHLPQFGSALIDAGSTADLPVDTYDLDGDNDTAEALPTDARGSARVYATAVDIGAAELDVVNAAPTDITLSSTFVGQSGGPNATVGTLSTTDADGDDSQTYTFVAGTGDTDNAAFAIETNVIQVGSSALVAGSYSIRVQTDDGHGGIYEEAFTITVVDDIAPQIASVVAPADATYRAGQNLDFTVRFTEVVPVNGTPILNLTIDSATLSATYRSGSGSSNLVFRYTVQAGDNDADGIAANSPIALNGGTIQDAAGNNAGLTFSAPFMTGVLVDAVAPQIISIVRKTPSQQTVTTNTTVFTVTFSENVVGVIPARFAVTPVNPSTATGTVTSVSGGPSIYDVTVNLTGGPGEFRLDVTAPVFP